MHVGLTFLFLILIKKRSLKKQMLTEQIRQRLSGAICAILRTSQNVLFGALVLAASISLACRVWGYWYFSLHSGNVVDVILFALVAMANLSRRKKLVKQRAVVQKKKQKFRLVSSKSLNLSIEAANWLDLRAPDKCSLYCGENTSDVCAP